MMVKELKFFLKDFYSRQAYQKFEEKVLPIVALGFMLNLFSIISLPLFSDSIEKCRPFVQGLLCAMMFYGAIAIAMFAYDVWGVHEYGE